ncbi:MAG: lipopolysaccharide biosynthesis protein, partial [Bacteroidales bacterium]|nr:lipopolysaccharide biosynthesis protein [Bacteroidales bacterium]
MGAHSENSRRIVKNTLMLYVRMLVLMLIGFYTSRVVLGALGESDYGVYNVIGGVVAMFTVISGALNSAISRFITFELGKDDGNGEDNSISRASQLNKVYSTAVLIQAAIALIVAAVAEPVGIWFINNEMTIAPERIPAATWVLHFSVLSFVINLLSVPQMASITAHERMSAYAYIGLLDGFLRLMVAFLILRAPFDRLISYAALMAVVVLVVRIAYGVYCRRNFEECRFRPVFDARLVREMFSFAGWNFIGVSSGVLRDHGGNILVNLFFGPAMNAARGVAMQVFTALQGFVTNFMTAVNPQITKSYAAGEKEYMFSLMRKSSRMAYYLLLIIALPVLFNIGKLLDLWLDEVPQMSVGFARLFLILALSESLSGPLMTGMLATGKIRNYQILVGGLIMMNFPVSCLFLKL